jgi:putative salt-induced outer membrane protein YdiY
MNAPIRRRSEMKKTLTFSLIMITVAFLIAGNSLADEVRLKNGDKLTGQIVRMVENKLIFKTTYAGEITIAWQEVASVRADSSVKVLLKDETALEGTMGAIEDGKMKLDTGKLEAPASFSLADVKAINPEPVKTVKINTRANISVTNERGNTKSDNYYFDGEFVARTEKNRYKIGGELTNEKADGITTSQNWLAYGNYSHFLNEKWYLYADTLFEHDEFKDLNLRTTLGGGAGYQFFETPLLNLSISAGLAMVDENFDVAEDNDYSAGQWTVNYDQYFFEKFVQLFHVNTGFISLEDANNWFLKTRTGLRFPLYKGLTATLQYNFDWDNQPSAAAETEEDTKFIFLLGYEFKN